MDFRGLLVLSAVAALACGDDAGGDTDTDTDTDTGSVITLTSPDSSDTFDPPDTFPDTFDDDDASDSLTDSDPTGATFTASESDTASDTVTESDTASATASESESDTATDTASDTDTATDGDTDTATDGDTDSDSDSDSDTVDPTDPTAGDAGACCEAQDGAPGCENDVVMACVCEEDPYCCDEQWDEYCVVSVVIHGCGTCEGVGGEGDCCAANGTPGCDDDAIEACVCEVDSVCCLEGWDETCAQGVEFENCGMCP